MKRLKRTISLALAVVMLMSMMTGAYAAKSRANSVWDNQKSTWTNLSNFLNKKGNVKIWMYAQKQVNGYKEPSLKTKKVVVKKGKTASGRLEAVNTGYKSVQLGGYWYKLSDFGFSWDFTSYDYVLPKNNIPAYTDPKGANRAKKNSKNVSVTGVGYPLVVTADSGSYVQVFLGSNEMFWVKKSDIFVPTITSGKSYVIESKVNTKLSECWCLTPFWDSGFDDNDICIRKINHSRNSKDIDNKLYRFKVVFNKNTGFYTIMNEKSGVPLDVTGASGANGVQLQLWKSNGSYAQQFQIIKRNKGEYEIRSRLGTDIDLKDGKLKNYQLIQMWEPANNKNQRWNFTLEK